MTGDVVDTVQVQTLAEFLLARIAEDEEVARELLARPPLEHRHTGPGVETWKDRDYLEEGLSLSPERLLAECEAKRRVLAALDVAEDCEIPAEAWVIGKDVLRALAAPYADHPDYREEWRP